MPLPLNLDWSVDLVAQVAESADARVSYVIRDDGKVGVADLVAKRLEFIDYELAADARKAIEARIRQGGHAAA